MSQNPKVATEPPVPAPYWRWLTWLLWLLPVLVISALVYANPEKRTVTNLYHEAVESFREGKGLYRGPAGMNYLPSFVPVFTPYHLLPLKIADVIWRWTAAAGLWFGMWRLTNKLQTTPSFKPMALVTLLGLPLCLGALRNGQANAHLGAVLLLAATFLECESWWGAAVCLGLAVAIKPLGLAAMGLAFAAYPKLWWRLLITVGAALAGPFLFGPSHYVWSQYVEAFHNLQNCSQVTQNRFADLNGLLRTFGFSLEGRASLLIRAGAGMGLALFCFTAVRRLPRWERALAWAAAAAGFLMLFNPMNEANSYVILGPVMALWAFYFAQSSRLRMAITLAAMLVTMSVLPTLLRPWLGNSFALAWHPAMTILFLTLLFRFVCDGVRNEVPIQLRPSYETT